MNINDLTIEEIRIIIEALLFSSSADIIADWNEEDASKMIDLAVKIKRKIGLTSENVLSEKIRISSEKNCDNLLKVNKIKTFFNLKEY